MAVINLLPWRSEFRAEQKKEFIKQFIIFFIAGVVLWFFWQCINVVRIVNQANKIDQLIKHMSYQQQEFLYYQKKLTLKKYQDETIKSLEKNRIKTHAMLGVLKELSSHMPATVYLSRFEKKGSVLLLEGKAQTHSDIASFLITLEKITHQPQALLKETSRDNQSQDDIDFSISYNMDSSPIKS